MSLIPNAMKSLEDLLEEWVSEECVVDGLLLDPAVAACVPQELLLEKKDYGTCIPGTKYYYRIDKPRGEAGDGNLRHIHVYADRNKQLFALNADGTAHDGCHGAKIDKQAAKFLRAKGFTVPDNLVIEWYRPGAGRQLLLD